uniref:MABP domain-containing protein n=1 Tax=Panagrolaimus sp. PS1159 TaxID=55785 RepID=A0AC35GCB4_9BILA
MGEELPIVSICVISDKQKCPPAFIPILKAFDDMSDADLWKDGGFFGFNRSLRYLAISRAISDNTLKAFDDMSDADLLKDAISDNNTLEVVTDLLIISEKEAIPANFISIDFTVDSNERALRKKYLCARFTPRNDALDAITDIIVLARSKRPPKGYTSAGEVDGMNICFKVSTISETYGRLVHSQSNPGPLYPAVPTKILNEEYRRSNPNLDSNKQLDFNQFTIRAQKGSIKGIDGIPFKLRPDLKAASTRNERNTLPELINPQFENFSYNFATERQCVH